METDGWGASCQPWDQAKSEPNEPAPTITFES